MSQFNDGQQRRATRTGRVALSMVLCVAGVTSVIGSSAAAGRQKTVDAKAVYEPRLAVPDSPSPYQAFLADEEAGDVAGWNLYLNAAGKTRASKEAPGAPRQGLRIVEQEVPGDSTNDTQATAESVSRFGTAPGSQPAAGIAGSAAGDAGDTRDLAIIELDGSFAEATDVLLEIGDNAAGAGVIGDEPGPNGPPDFDFFRFPGLTAGQTLTVDIDTPDPFGDLDSFVAVWNPDLAPSEIAVNDDGDGQSFDSFLTFTVPVDGDYFVSVGGFGAFVPSDPTDSASPSVTGEVGSEGAYDVTLSLMPPTDIDFYDFELQAGDIVGATVSGAGLRLELYADDGSLLIGSSQDVTFIHPAVSPLPGGGNASASYIVETAGIYSLAVEASGPYEVDLRAFRPAKERTGNATQTVFIDFDGASIDPGIFQGEALGFEVPLSPLSAFLPAWGLTPADEDAVIDGIIASVEESLSADIRTLGNNGDRHAGGGPGAFDVEILNSRDHDDPWGDPYVSRLIVGGTIPELGIGTIGIAESIDVGDFESEESAVILLDLLSGVGPFPAPEADLNNYPLSPTATITDLIAVAVGNITAHEAGHFFSNWHTDQFNSDANLQDQGGNLPGFIGIGPDGIFGTADDVDVDFGKDVYNPNEGFAGTEDTLQTISFGLSTGHGRGNR